MMLYPEKDNTYKTLLTDIAIDAPSLCQSAQVDQRGMAYGVGSGIEHARPVVFDVHRMCNCLYMTWFGMGF